MPCPYGVCPEVGFCSFAQWLSRLLDWALNTGCLETRHKVERTLDKLPCFHV